MKIGRLGVNILKWHNVRAYIKRRKLYPPHGQFLERLDIPYINDGNVNHKFDLYYGDRDKKKNVCILYIHGGSYIFGEHQDSYWYALTFLKEGYDFISLDYIPNDGKRSVKDSLDDIYKNINCVLSHQKELNIEGDNYVIAGDSAGGHFALLFAEAMTNNDVAKKLGYSFPDVKVIAALLSCPVYDFEDMNVGNAYLNNSGLKRLFGPTYNDKELFRLVSPRTYINELEVPLFVNTCKQDFLREQSLLIQSDLKDRDLLFELVDINTDEKGIGHVHNVLGPEREKSIEVNNAAMAFIEKASKLKRKKKKIDKEKVEL